MADLEKALKTGRGQLDASTIAIVEHNLQIIDQAIDQAREALAADPANSYLSSHLVRSAAAQARSAATRHGAHERNGLGTRRRNDQGLATKTKD